MCERGGEIETWDIWKYSFDIYLSGYKQEEEKDHKDKGKQIGDSMTSSHKEQKK